MAVRNTASTAVKRKTVNKASATVEKPTKRSTGKKAEPKYTKEQIVSSATFADDADIISAMLPDGEYTKKEVAEVVSRFKKGKVN